MCVFMQGSIGNNCSEGAVVWAMAQANSQNTKSLGKLVISLLDSGTTSSVELLLRLVR